MLLDSLQSYVSNEVLIAVGVLLVIFLIKIFINNRNSNFPPGPFGLPIIGYLPFLTQKPYLKFQKLAKQYGPVFSLSFGSLPVVVLNNSKVIKEAFSKPEILGRPPVSIFTLSNLESPFFSNGKVWLEHRRFALHAMRDLGLGKSKMQEHIKDEIVHFLEVVDKKKGQPFDIKVPLTPSMSNNICSLVFGKRYEYDDPDRILLDETLETVLDLLVQTSYVLFFPWINKIPIINKLLKFDCGHLFEPSVKFVRKEIEIHKKTLDRSDIRDYIDSYLIEMESKAAEDPDNVYTESMLIGAVQNLFGAGSETVRTTIGWCLYTVAAYPEVQKKVQKEIDDIIGRERLPEFSDQKELIYTLSVLTEVQRWQTVVPVNLLRYALGDTTVAGFNIPKGTYVVANIYGAHRDPESWKNPNDFVPDRFISSDGKSIVKSNSYLAFSSGKRNCPGESLAAIEVFLYFTSILQKFDVKLPTGQKVDFEGVLDITYHIKPHELCLTRRK